MGLLYLYLLLYPLIRRLGGPQSQSGRFGEEKNLFSLPIFKPQLVQSTA
jgi:hypothetical protein